jgi:hypothetical protein
VRDQGRFKFFQGADDALEGRGDVGEVRYAASDDKNLAVWTRSTASDEIDLIYKSVKLWVVEIDHERLTDRFRVFVCLALRRSSRVFSIVSQFMSKPVGGDGIRINDRSATSSDHSPNASLGIEDGQLERGSSGPI